MANQRLGGAMTALVTPFLTNGAIDLESLRKLVDRQIESGIQGLVPCGTTGEAAALTIEEHHSVVRTVVDQTAGRAIVVAGAGANNTRQAIALSEICQEAGADALLHIAPGYIKPTQRGIIRHFEEILSAVDLPLVIYNVPGRTAVNILPETLLKLAEDPRITGVKQAVADLDQLSTLLANRPPSLSVLSGEDSLTLPMVALGADGVVSVVGNEFPVELVKMVHAAIRGERDEAIHFHRLLTPIMRANFVESNPIPVKFAMASMGLIENQLRSPMTSLDSSVHATVLTALDHASRTTRATMPAQSVPAT